MEKHTRRGDWDRPDEAFIETETYLKIQRSLANQVYPLLIFGPGGAGKTVVLKQLARYWSNKGGTVCFLQLGGIDDETSLFRALYSDLTGASDPHLDRDPFVVSSSAESLRNSTISLVRSVDPAPLILFDGFDETRNPRVASEIIRLLSRTTSARIIVSSRTPEHQWFDDFRYDTIATVPLSNVEFDRLLEANGVNSKVLRTAPLLYDEFGKIPLAATLLARYISAHPEVLPTDIISSLARFASGDSQQSSVDVFSSLGETLRTALERVLSSAQSESGRTKIIYALSLLAVCGPIRIADLKLDDETTKVICSSGLAIMQDSSLLLTHRLIAQAIVSFAQILPTTGIRLHDLDFGSEEAERDSLLAISFVNPPGIDELCIGRKSIVVGDRGSGKSALFAELARRNSVQAPKVQIFTLDDPADLMLRLEANGNRLASAEQFRAAWLLAVACNLATNTELKSSRQQRLAAQLRASIPGGVPDSSMSGRLNAIWRRIRRTSVKFQLGPIVLEPAKGVEPTNNGSSALDISAFLREVAATLKMSDKHVVVAIDRIDEVYKYDRNLQEKLVQGLFLAEGSLAQMPEISLLVFVRTDLFEVYDIQEKNKLVSRTARLHWSRDNLLRLIVQRVLTNPSLSKLAELLKDRTNDHLAEVLRAIFPSEIEGTPFTAWLWQCLENGNGDVSPRQLVLLLVLTRQVPTEFDTPISELPIIREGALRWAMTKLSELSFNETVNDFRVARTLLRNCRAGKLSLFRLTEVEKLFEASEGPTGLQVELLEKLGVLERVVVLEPDGNNIAKFRIPMLYTRCWA